MCHSAVANGQIILTNSQLASSYSSATRAQGYGASLIVASGVIGVGIGLSLPAATAGAGTCASTGCAKTIEQTFEGASTIADDAYVAIHPITADVSIDSVGLSPGAADSEYVWVTQMKYYKGLNLETAADNAGVDVSKWLSQPVTLWEVMNTSENIANLQPDYGAFGNIPQWISSSPLYPMIMHPQIP
jgi:hypothetical protein